MSEAPLNSPKWYQLAWNDLGLHEDPDNTGPVIQKLIEQAHCGQQHDPWCAIFANAKLEMAGIKGTQSASSQSFAHSPRFFQLAKPTLGCISVFWRVSPHSGLGHVGFYGGETASQIMVLGGNEQDAVRNELMPRNSGHFGLVGYYWPSGEVVTGAGIINLSSADAHGSQEPFKVV